MPGPSAPEQRPEEPRDDAPSGAADGGANVAGSGARTPRRRAGDAAVLVAFSLTALVAAALLFAVQPMAAKLVLPRTGGSAAVWSAAALFFQVALLAGYALAHAAARRLPPTRGAAAQVGLLGVALLTLPVGLPAWDAPDGGSPALFVVAAFAAGLGLPFVAVATTAPSLQRWLSATDHPRASDPYVLYAASNLGSLAGLAAYPVLIEPRLSLSEQADLWSAGYGLVVLLAAGCALAAARRPAAEGEGAAAAHAADGGAAPGGTTAGASPAPRRTTRRELATWVGLAFVPSSLMLAVTTAISTDLTPVPLLWVVPLAIYLLSFVVVFGPSARLARAARIAGAVGLVPFALLLAFLLATDDSDPLGLTLTVHLGVLATAALAVHGRLAQQRPEPARLTTFLLATAAGGALGGVFNALVAPVVFTELTELPLSVVLALATLPTLSKATGRAPQVLDVLLPLAVLVLAYALFTRDSEPGDPRDAIAGATTTALGVTLMLVIRPVRLALGVGAVLLAAALALPPAEDVLHRDRTFYGVLRVDSDVGGQVRSLLHGTTLHGNQSTRVGRPLVPSAYYHPTSPAGDAVRQARRNRGGPLRAGVVGLGTGTMACHARDGERWTFFELDAAVARIARDPSLFTYLRDCPGTHDVVLGDGRVSLRAAAGERFGLLVLDAFSSDAIPLHLVTREAVALYRDRLARGGVLAFHISNRHLRLEAPLGDVARDLGLTCRTRQDESTGPDGREIPDKVPSHWVLIARSGGDLAGTGSAYRPCATAPGRATWTDDRSDLWSVLEW